MNTRSSNYPVFWPMRSWHWIVFYGFVLLSWLLLFAFGVGTAHVPPSVLSDPVGWFSLLMVRSHPHSIETMAAMWMLMSAAMMLPSMVPVIHVYDDLRSAGAGSRPGAIFLVCGYLTVWLGFGMVMTIIQINLDLLSFRNSWSMAVSGVASAALLLAAGLYQFSTVKDRCLLHCRNPLVVFMARGETSLAGEFVTGIGFGLWCVACCWLLMAIGLISGLMSLAGMGLATLIITVEKLPSLGRFVSRPLGGLLVAASVVVAIASLA